MGDGRAPAAAPGRRRRRPQRPRRRRPTRREQQQPPTAAAARRRRRAARTPRAGGGRQGVWPVRKGGAGEGEGEGAGGGDGEAEMNSHKHKQAGAEHVQTEHKVEMRYVARSTEEIAGAAETVAARKAAARRQGRSATRLCREIAARNVDITVAEWELLVLAASSGGRSISMLRCFSVQTSAPPASRPPSSSRPATGCTRRTGSASAPSAEARSSGRIAPASCTATERRARRRGGARAKRRVAADQEVDRRQKQPVCLNAAPWVNRDAREVELRRGSAQRRPTRIREALARSCVVLRLSHAVSASRGVGFSIHRCAEQDGV